MVPYDPVWFCMLLYTPVRSLMVPYGPIWSHMDLYGPAWSCMVPYGPDWAHIGDDFVAKKSNNEIESNYGYMVNKLGHIFFQDVAQLVFLEFNYFILHNKLCVRSPAKLHILFKRKSLAAK